MSPSAPVRIVLLLAVALLAAACGDPPVTTDPGSGAPAAPPTAEEVLLDSLPASASSCAAIEGPAGYLAGAEASVSCATDGAESVDFHLFADEESLDAAFAASLDLFDLPPAGATCADAPYAGEWARDGERLGEVQCYVSNDERAVIEWSEPGTLVYGMLTGGDADVGALLGVWEGLSGGTALENAAAPEVDPTPAPDEFSEYASIRTWFGENYDYIHFRAVLEGGDGEIVTDIPGSDPIDLDDELEAIEETPKRRELVDALRRELEGMGWTEVGQVEGGEWYEYRFGR